MGEGEDMVCSQVNGFSYYMLMFDKHILVARKIERWLRVKCRKDKHTVQNTTVRREASNRNQTRARHMKIKKNPNQKSN